ncbi:MAG TPA: hypothetical protein VMY88_11415 [Acidimicrobiales bacterium]|nr:hypothetical protein [Acidimicrobiales bacterium]
MNRFRAAGLLFVVLSVFAAGSVQAAPPLKFTDDAGDALDTRASQDILSVTLDQRQVNKTGAPSLVFELELAAPPESELATYGIRTIIPGCGYFQAQFRPGGHVWAQLGADTADFATECADPTLLPAKFRITGNVLTWAIALDGLPKKFRSGKIESIDAYTSISEPASGFIGTGDLDVAPGPLPMDLASTDKTWSY